MANHVARSTPQPVVKSEPELPILKWATIVKTPEGYSLATMTTRGSKILTQDLERPEPHRPFVEDQFRIWTVLNILDRGDE